MGDFCKGAAFGLMAGMAIGAIVVAKNKKLAGKIKTGMEQAETKICEAKQMIEEKVQQAEEEKMQQASSGGNMPESKKSKN